MRKAFILVLIWTGLLSGQTAAEKAILDYQLTVPRADQLITAMEAMTKYVVSLPDYQDRVRKSLKMTPAESPANVTFAKQHLTELKPKMDSADGITARK